VVSGRARAKHDHRFGLNAMCPSDCRDLRGRPGDRRIFAPDSVEQRVEILAVIAVGHRDQPAAKARDMEVEGRDTHRARSPPAVPGSTIRRTIRPRRPSMPSPTTTRSGESPDGHRARCADRDFPDLRSSSSAAAARAIAAITDGAAPKPFSLAPSRGLEHLRHGPAPGFPARQTARWAAAIRREL
jgi:hypothetical protein